MRRGEGGRGGGAAEGRGGGVGAGCATAITMGGSVGNPVRWGD